MKICDSDPLVSTVRDEFGATLLRTPDGRFQPGSVIAKSVVSATQPRFWGHFVDIAPSFVQPPTLETQLPQVSRASSGSMKISLGLSLLDGLLSGMGSSVPIDNVDAELGFSNAKEMSLQFPAARRRYMHLAQLGAALSDCQLARHGGTELFFEDWALILIDGVLETDQLRVETNAERGAQLASQPIPISANLTATWDRWGRVVFKCHEPVPFAFTAITLEIDKETNNISIVPEFELGTVVAAAPGYAVIPPKRVMLSGPDELLEGLSFE